MIHLNNIIPISSKKGLVIYHDEYPSDGSWPNRINNYTKIFKQLNIEYKILVPYPPQKICNNPYANDIVIRLQETKNSKIKPLNAIYFYLRGIYKSYIYAKGTKNLDFILFAGGSFATCYFILKFCKRKSITVWIDIVDENSKKFEINKSIRDHLAIFNKHLFDKYLVRKFDKVFVISDYLLSKYRNISRDMNISKSVPSIIDLEEYDRNSERDITGISYELDLIARDPRLKLLYAGSIARPNGIKFVLNCASDLIIKQNYDFIIVIIVLLGDKRVLLQHATDLGIEKNLFLVDKQTQTDLPAIYKQSDILFLPEHGTIIANAGFPGKVAEMLASTKPVISTIFSDLESYLINGVNSLISPIGDYFAYKNNLLKLLENSELRNALGNEGRKTAETKFDYKACLPMFRDLVS